jgi:hypothetical protein
MSHEAIAAAMARDDLSCGERLVAFSLASYADRENRAFPGTVAAAGRAGLEKSRYLEARGQLVRRGLVVVEHQARGRGRATTLALRFAATGPWWDGEINAEMFEAVLAYSQTQGSSRLLLASFAALADERGVVECVSLDQLCKRPASPRGRIGERRNRCWRRGSWCCGVPDAAVGTPTHGRSRIHGRPGPAARARVSVRRALQGRHRSLPPSRRSLACAPVQVLSPPTSAHSHQARVAEKAVSIGRFQLKTVRH